MRDRRVAGVHEAGDATRLRRERAQRINAPRLEVPDEEGDPGDVAAGTLERGDQARIHRIIDAERDDRQLVRGGLRAQRGLGSARDEDVDRQAHQLPGQARGFKLEALLVDVRKRSQIEEAFELARSREADALIVQLGSLGAAQRQSVVELAARHRLPAIYPSRTYVDAGGLVSYGMDATQLFYRAGAFVDRLARGAKAADNAMEPPPRFELVINRKTLRALDLVIPPDLLLRSNEIV